MAASPVRVLLIEDNSGDALLVTEMLKDIPDAYQVERADRLSSAEHLMERRRFDLIVMDLNLPDCAGMEAVRRIRAKSTIPVVILTGIYDSRIDAQAAAEGVGAYLVKGKTDSAGLHASLVQVLNPDVSADASE